jgi:hypothetical protein
MLGCFFFNKSAALSSHHPTVWGIRAPLLKISNIPIEPICSIQHEDLDVNIYTLHLLMIYTHRSGKSWV